MNKRGACPQAGLSTHGTGIAHAQRVALRQLVGLTEEEIDIVEGKK
jgi:hypothetical protein